MFTAKILDLLRLFFDGDLFPVLNLALTTCSKILAGLCDEFAKVTDCAAQGRQNEYDRVDSGNQ
jgi:hypothetical protein